jgi:glycerophosphoryl diester phosphodiesterase
MIVAHRGASRDAPENTMPAFELAWAQGADAIEGDFHLTKDGHIVCIHDGNTKRVSNTNLVVRGSTLAELRAVDVGAHRGNAFKGAVIPTIAEVFSTIPEQKTIYIEIKGGTEIIPPLLDEIKNSGLKKEQILLISFNKKMLQELKTKDPEMKASWLSGFKKGVFGKMAPSLETVLATLKKIKADGFSSTKDIIDEAFVKSIIEEGYEYHVWTVDDLETARRFNSWGAKSITTNVPDHIRKALSGEASPADADK